MPNDAVSREAVKGDDRLKRDDVLAAIHQSLLEQLSGTTRARVGYAIEAAIASLPAVDAGGRWEKLRAKLSGRIAEIKELVGKPIPGERGILECECDALEEMLEWMVEIKGEPVPPAAERAEDWQAKYNDLAGRIDTLPRSADVEEIMLLKRALKRCAIELAYIIMQTNAKEGGSIWKAHQQAVEVLDHDISNSGPAAELKGEQR